MMLVRAHLVQRVGGPLHDACIHPVLHSQHVAAAVAIHHLWATMTQHGAQMRHKDEAAVTIIHL